jgi:hypothetical protein
VLADASLEALRIRHAQLQHQSVARARHVQRRGAREPHERIAFRRALGSMHARAEEDRVACDRGGVEAILRQRARDLRERFERLDAHGDAG